MQPWIKLKCCRQFEHSSIIICVAVSLVSNDVCVRFSASIERLIQRDSPLFVDCRPSPILRASPGANSSVCIRMHAFFLLLLFFASRCVCVCFFTAAVHHACGRKMLPKVNKVNNTAVDCVLALLCLFFSCSFIVVVRTRLVFEEQKKRATLTHTSTQTSRENKYRGKKCLEQTTRTDTYHKCVLAGLARFAVFGINRFWRPNRRARTQTKRQIGERQAQKRKMRNTNVEKKTSAPKHGKPSRNIREKPKQQQKNRLQPRIFLQVAARANYVLLLYVSARSAWCGDLDEDTTKATATKTTTTTATMMMVSFGS